MLRGSSTTTEHSDPDSPAQAATMCWGVINEVAASRKIVRKTKLTLRQLSQDLEVSTYPFMKLDHRLQCNLLYFPCCVMDMDVFVSTLPLFVYASLCMYWCTQTVLGREARVSSKAKRDKSNKGETSPDKKDSDDDETEAEDHSCEGEDIFISASPEGRSSAVSTLRTSGESDGESFVQTRDSEQLGLRDGDKSKEELLAHIAELTSKCSDMEKQLDHLIKHPLYSPAAVRCALSAFYSLVTSSGEMLLPSALHSMNGVHLAPVGHPAFKYITRIRHIIHSSTTHKIPAFMLIHDGHVIWSDFDEAVTAHISCYARWQELYQLRKTVQDTLNPNDQSNQDSSPSITPSSSQSQLYHLDDETEAAEDLEAADEYEDAVEQEEEGDEGFFDDVGVSIEEACADIDDSPEAVKAKSLPTDKRLRSTIRRRISVNDRISSVDRNATNRKPDQRPEEKTQTHPLPIDQEQSWRNQIFATKGFLSQANWGCIDLEEAMFNKKNVGINSGDFGNCEKSDTSAEDIWSPVLYSNAARSSASAVDEPFHYHMIGRLLIYKQARFVVTLLLAADESATQPLAAKGSPLPSLPSTLSIPSLCASLQRGLTSELDALGNTLMSGVCDSTVVAETEKLKNEKESRPVLPSTVKYVVLYSIFCVCGFTR